MKKQRRNHSQEFKREAVALVVDRGGPQWLDRDRDLISEIFWLNILEREGAEDDPKKAT